MLILFNLFECLYLFIMNNIFYLYIITSSRHHHPSPGIIVLLTVWKCCGWTWRDKQFRGLVSQAEGGDNNLIFILLAKIVINLGRIQNKSSRFYNKCLFKVKLILRIWWYLLYISKLISLLTKWKYKIRIKYFCVHVYCRLSIGEFLIINWKERLKIW